MLFCPGEPGDSFSGDSARFSVYRRHPPLSGKRFSSIFIGFFVLAFVGIAFYVGWDMVHSSKLYSGRLGEMGDVVGRYQQYMLGLKIFLTHPLRGIGYGNWFQVAHTEYGIHNSFVKTLTELGLVGFVFTLLYFISILFKGFGRVIVA